jgi:nucleotide-binding universal stress UspA family protein
VGAVSRILLATDGSLGAQQALRLLIDLRPRPEDVIHVVCAAEHGLVPRVRRDHADAVADEAVARLRYAGCAAIAEAAGGSPACAIVDAAQRIRADVIVLGSRGLGRWTGALLGSTARGVIHGSSTPVLVVRGQAAAPQWILLATTDLRGVRSGAHALGLLPWTAEAAIDVLTPSLSGATPDVPHLADVFDEAKRALPGMDLRVHAADHGSFPKEIHRYAQQLAADLVVLSLDLDDEPLADAVVGGARCPVLVVPVPAEPVRPREPAAKLAVAL